MPSYTFSQLIDFTRTTSGTFVNSAGLIATTPVSTNLLLFTQEFDNAAWSKNNVTIAANSTTAPDGTTTADTITASAGAAVHNIQQSASVAAQGAASFYVKAGTHNFVQILFGPNSNIYANFNVSTGVVGTVGSSATASISAIGDGWYRCAIVCTPGSAGNFRLAMISSNTSAFNESWTAAGTETIFAWGAQVENGSTATTYVRNYGGLYPPRFDYDPVTLAPKGLLIEEQRTNLATYSAQFDNEAWTKTNASITANATTSPDGTVNADTLVEDTANASHTITMVALPPSGVAVAFSFYAKAAGRSRIALNSGGGFAGQGFAAIFDLSNGTMAVNTGGKGSITAVGNGWYRCVIAFTTSNTVQFSLGLADNSNQTTYTGDGTSGVYLFGAQLEAGAFATSYIPTVASQVTRTADVAQINAPNFAPWYNASAGTFTVGFDTTWTGNADISRFVLSLEAGANKRVVYINAGANTAAVREDANALFATGVVVPGPSKVASAYSGSTKSIVSNGGAVATGSFGGWGSPSLLCLGSTGSGNYISGHIRSVRYYPTQLTDAQLQALTA